MTELRSGNSDRVPSRSLLGQYDLLADSLRAGVQRAEVDTGGEDARGKLGFISARSDIAFGQRPHESAARVIHAD